MKATHIIVITLLLVTAFCIFFGWCLYKSCRRVIDVEHHELRCRQEDGEAGTVKSDGAKSAKSGGKSVKSAAKSAAKSSKSAPKSARSAANSGAAAGPMDDMKCG
ncbi:hypothetical protein Ptr902_02347 [Pyrenophora tritici-repentis]|nr:hypothetical protein Ptr902_02347 [Pyrenophora tritici-repentis]